MSNGFQYIQIVLEGGEETLEEWLESENPKPISEDDLRAAVGFGKHVLLMSARELERVRDELPAAAERYLKKDDASEYLAVQNRDIPELNDAIAEMKIAKAIVKQRVCLLRQVQPRDKIIEAFTDGKLPDGPVM